MAINNKPNDITALGFRVERLLVASIFASVLYDLTESMCVINSVIDRMVLLIYLRNITERPQQGMSPETTVCMNSGIDYIFDQMELMLYLHYIIRNTITREEYLKNCLHEEYQ
jgi:hypothetical protein